MALVDPALRALYDLKVSSIHFDPFVHIVPNFMLLFLDLRPM